MRAIVWSDDALNDFDSALFYVAKDNNIAADLIADRVDSALKTLASIPIGHPGRVEGTYEKRVLKTPYIIAYALNEETLTILRVIHSSQDWRKNSWPD
jgi:plasmid stabilization system protein ParE